MRAWLIMFVAGHARAVEYAAAPLLDSHCKIQDPYACVQTPGCGFCMNTFTCMVAGGPDGPAEGLLPCPKRDMCGPIDRSWCAAGSPALVSHTLSLSRANHQSLGS